MALYSWHSNPTRQRALSRWPSLRSMVLRRSERCEGVSSRVWRGANSPINVYENIYPEGPCLTTAEMLASAANGFGWIARCPNCSRQAHCEAGHALQRASQAFLRTVLVGPLTCERPRRAPQLLQLFGAGARHDLYLPQCASRLGQGDL